MYARQRPRRQIRMFQVWHKVLRHEEAGSALPQMRRGPARKPCEQARGGRTTSAGGARPQSDRARTRGGRGFGGRRGGNPALRRGRARRGGGRGNLREATPRAVGRGYAALPLSSLRMLAASQSGI